MLYWALVFLVVAIIAGLLGFGGIAEASAGIAQVLFFLFLVLLFLALVMHFVRGRPPAEDGNDAPGRRPRRRRPDPELAGRHTRFKAYREDGVGPRRIATLRRRRYPGGVRGRRPGATR